MKILSLKEAAEYLGYGKEFVRLKAKKGEIRGLKCRDWRFSSDDLDHWFNLMAKGGIQKREKEQCPSVNIKTVLSGTSTFGTRDSEYLEVLGLKTEKKRNDTMTR